MTILVTGATGFLGTALVRELLRQRQALHTLATSGFREACNPAWEAANLAMQDIRILTRNEKMPARNSAKQLL